MISFISLGLRTIKKNNKAPATYSFTSNKCDVPFSSLINHSEFKIVNNNK